MISTTQRELIEKLAEIQDLSPGARFGELLANLAFLVEDQTDQTIREVDDDRLMAVMNSHRRDLQRRLTDD